MKIDSKIAATPCALILSFMPLLFSSLVFVQCPWLFGLFLGGEGYPYAARVVLRWYWYADAGRRDDAAFSWWMNCKVPFL